MQKPIIITMGDPTGIGPEIIVKAASQRDFENIAGPVVVAGDPAVLVRAAEVCGLAVEMKAGGQTALDSHVLSFSEADLLVAQRVKLPMSSLRYGNPDLACGRAMVDAIHWACDVCLQGEAAGMVTAPINKQAMQAAGEPFSGHTELLAERCGVKQVVMMLAGPRLRVCLVTTHCPLNEVSQRLTTAGILRTIEIADDALRRDFGCVRPRLAVLALNPHGGESGLFGDEEQVLIMPAILQARANGFDVSGPHSADSLFWHAVQGNYDAVICMYHDQGLIPLKLLHFDDAVNVTLGLPIIRTSVDHGTAYDLAGSGKARTTSLVAAVRMAAVMAEKRSKETRIETNGE